MTEASEAVTAELELAAATAVVTAMTVLEITSWVTAAPSERAEAQLPQRGSAAAMAEFPAGVAAAATMAVVAAEILKKGKKRAAAHSKRRPQSRHKETDFSRKTTRMGERQRRLWISKRTEAHHHVLLISRRSDATLI